MNEYYYKLNRKNHWELNFLKKLFIPFLIAFLSLSAFAQTKIMPLGESTTKAIPGYRKKLCDLAKADGWSIDMIGPNSDGTGLSYDGDNAGFSGKSCSGLIDILGTFYANYSPDIVLLLEGTNDCGWAYQYYINNHPIIDELSKLIDEICLKYPNALIFVSSIPPMSEDACADFPTPFGVANANATTYNNAIPALINTKISAGKKVSFIDTRSLLNVSTDISADGIHPNKQGYEKIGELFYSAIHSYLTSVLTETESDVSVYPNPVTNYQLSIKSKKSVTEKILLSLYDLTGRMLYSTTVKYSPVIYILLPQYLRKGLYFLNIDNGINRITKRIIIE